MFFRRKPRFWLFLVIYLHVTVLDWVLVNGRGQLIFKQVESLRLETVMVHLLIALATWLVFVLTDVTVKKYRQTKLSTKEPILIYSSAAMAIAIGVMLLS
ncbi:hypothetical protein [Colwellia sp. MEBiC06753]